MSDDEPPKPQDLIDAAKEAVARIQAEAARRKRNVIAAVIVIGLLWYKGRR